jgi:uncharacterized protein YneF (UPF0154 family)
MVWYVLGSLVVGFIVGFFVGGKHKESVMRKAGEKIQDIGRKL